MSIRRIALLLLAAGLTHTSLAQADRIDDYLRAEMARAHIPGAAVAVVKAGKLVKLQAYGTANIETGTPVTSTSAFQIASGTKMFTAVLLMDLVGQGKIGLDDPLAKYIKDAPAAWKDITVRMLAAHTSGLPRGPVTHKIQSVAEAVTEAAKKPLASAPGEVAAYGSDDFSILTYILETVSGMPYEQLLQERIAKPLGMLSTRFDGVMIQPDAIVSARELVPGRVETYQWKTDRQQQYIFMYPGYTRSAGGLFSSIGDMGKFAQALVGGKMMNAQLAAEMSAPFMLKNGKPGGFAVGWTVGQYRGFQQVGHSGGPALSDFAWYPEQQLAVVVLTNQRKNFPRLASGVANFFLPLPGFINESGIEDRAPAQTAAFRDALLTLPKGKADPARYSGEAKAQIAELNDWMPMQLGGLPALSRLVLLSESEGRRTRTYRAVYGKEWTQRWKVVFDANGLIADLDVSDE